MGLTYDRIVTPIVNTVLESFTAPEQRTRARAIRQQMAECEINMLVTRDLSENTCANRLTANRYRGINVTRDAFKPQVYSQPNTAKRTFTRAIAGYLRKQENPRPIFSGFYDCIFNPYR